MTVSQAYGTPLVVKTKRALCLHAGDSFFKLLSERVRG